MYDVGRGLEMHPISRKMTGAKKIENRKPNQARKIETGHSKRVNIVAECIIPQYERSPVHLPPMMSGINRLHWPR